MIRLAPFEIEHFDWILPRLRSIDAISIQGLDLVEYRKTLEGMMDSAPIGSFVTDDGQVAAICGALKKWDGVADFWMLTSNLVTKFPLSFHKSCIEGLDFLMSEFGIHRLQASIAERHVISQKWAHRLGFQPEGLMKAYGPDGANHYLYARVNL